MSEHDATLLKAADDDATLPTKATDDDTALASEMIPTMIPPTTRKRPGDLGSALFAPARGSLESATDLAPEPILNVVAICGVTTGVV